MLLLMSLSPDVEFCAYAMPHPSEPKMNMRIQTYRESQSSADFLSTNCPTLLTLYSGNHGYRSSEEGSQGSTGPVRRCR